MQVIGRYALIATLGECEVGQVWSAVDAVGKRFTLAVMSAPAAAEQRWRDAFAATAYALSNAQTDGLPVVGVDFSAAEPWVACADEPGPGAAQVFLALGLQYRPTTADAAASPTWTDPANVEVLEPEVVEPEVVEPEVVEPEVVEPEASVGVDATAGAVPAQPAMTQATMALATVALATVALATVAQESPAQADPVPAVRAQPSPAQSAPAQSAPAQSAPAQSAPAQAAPRFAPPQSEPEPPELQRSMGRWLVAVSVVALLVGGSGGVIVGSHWPGLRTATPITPTSSIAPSSAAPVDLGLPTAPPTKPGIEPPKAGTWPAIWPKFGSADHTKQILTSRTGLGFTFKVPESWNCARQEMTSGYLRYTCGQGSVITGDVIVRQCPLPCNEYRRTTLRRSIEAWGLAWTKNGAYVTFVETNTLGGAAGYGLVYVAYWRTTSEGPVDRQLVFRMTSPVDRADELRKVANSIRDVTFID